LAEFVVVEIHAADLPLAPRVREPARSEIDNGTPASYKDHMVNTSLDRRFDTAAAALRDAYLRGPIPPLRDTVAPNDGKAAYQIQAINTAHWLANGRVRVGHKVGLTSKAVQLQLGVSQPDFGVLFEDMRINDRGSLRQGLLLQPKVEGEIAVRFHTDLTESVPTLSAVRAAIEGAAPAIEVVDSRIADWKITFADTVADNGSAAYFVTGDRFQPLDDLDLFSCGMVLELNGEVASTGAGAACLGNPLNAATWLAQALAARGTPIQAGDIVLTGALGPMVALRAGDTVRVTIGGLGSVGFSCKGNS
jgi:2-keto-4-pentenoate hydratase